MRRRDFITLCGGVAAAIPLPSRSQQPEQIRHIGVLMNLSSDDPEGKGRADAFLEGLGELGWTDGRNLRVDYRWGGGDTELFRRYAEELVTLAPDVILATGTPVVEALQRVTRTMPIVFVTVIDPVGAGF